MASSSPRISHGRARAWLLTAQAAALLAAAVAAALAAAVGAPPRGPLLVLAALALAAGAWRRRLATRWHIGQRSEPDVARRLAALGRRGWLLAHDLDRGHGNVDHLAIGPRDAYAIETKTTRRGAGELPQARANAAWASKRLGVPVVAVLCVTRRRCRPQIQAGVLCVDARRLRRTLARRRDASLDLAAVARRLPRA